MDVFEHKTAHVPAGRRRQSKALGKLAAQGWEVVQVRQLMGAGRATVQLKRNKAAADTTRADAVVSVLDSFSARMQASAERMKADNLRVKQERAAAKLSRKTSTKP